MRLLIVFFLFCTLSWCSFINNDDFISNNDVNHIIENNDLSNYYNYKTNNLSMNSQNLTSIPDLCNRINENIIPILESIDISNNKIQKVDVDFSCFHKLKEINLSYNEINDIKRLILSESLEKLFIHKNKLSNIYWMSGYNNLKELNLSYNNISNIDFLSKYTKLKNLKLHRNNIINISVLGDLKSLGILKLEYNNINDFSSIVNLTWLTELSVSNNNISKDEMDDLLKSLNNNQ